MSTKKNAPPFKPKTVLAVDVGGSNIKLVKSGSSERVKFPSGTNFTPRQLMAGIKKHAAHWEYDAVSLGLPTPIVAGKPVREPNNLGSGWVKFDYESAFGKPVKLLNDAAMQALGSYEGGRMLFLGLGTGLGSAAIFHHIVIPLELGELRQSHRHNLEGMLGRDGRKRLGQKKWEEALAAIVANLKMAFLPDYVVLGGGNARRVENLPPDCRRGDNRNAFLGGFRLWGLHPASKSAQTIVID